MAYSYVVYTGNGSTTQYTVSFPYIRREHISASINRVATSAFTWVNNSTIQFTTAPANGARVEIRRITPVNAPLVDFADGSTLVAADLDTNALQQTYINQEQADQFQDAIFVNSAGNLDAGGKQLDNLANPTDAQDAATKSYVDNYYGQVQTNNIVDSAVTTSKIQNGAITAVKIADGTVTNAKLAFDGGPLSGFRNAIINGNFDLWQRGVLNASQEPFGPAFGGFLADRWRTSWSGSEVSQRQTGSSLLITENFPGEPVFTWEGTVYSVVGASNFAKLTQPIENVRTLAGKTATLSFWARGVAGKKIAVEFSQHFGTPAGSTYVSGIGVTHCVLSASWQKFTVTASIPSVTLKTIGANGDDYLAVNFWFEAGSFFNSATGSLGHQSGVNAFYITQVQLEQGPSATPFEKRTVQQELALAQRYYHKETNGTIKGFVTENLSAHRRATVFFPQTMRAWPTGTITWSAGSAGAFFTRANYGTAEVNLASTTGETQISSYTVSAEL